MHWNHSNGSQILRCFQSSEDFKYGKKKKKDQHPKQLKFL